MDYNPFLSFDRGLDASAGVLNIAPVGGLHFQITRWLSLRFEVRAGLSVLLFDTPGYEAGTVGLYAGARLLGLDIRLTDSLSLMIDPVDISLPVFEIKKLPFYYKQWRVAAGLAWHF